MPVPKYLFFFQDLEGLTEVFSRMSAGISAPKLPLCADFSFLILRREPLGCTPGGHATARFLEHFSEGSVTASAS